MKMPVKWPAALAIVFVAATCRPSMPTPVPIPTPPPAPTPPPLLLRQPSPPHLTRDGQPFSPFGAIQCCMGSIETASAASKPPRRPLPFKPGRTEAVCNTLWPLASECWMDWTHAKGANFYHFRMGPFYGTTATEIDWAEFGGPYAGGPGSDWSPAFWAKYRDLLTHARSIGANVEVNVIDTWYCKHAQWGDQPMPWPPEDIDACGRRPSPEQEKYIRKVVSESKGAPHVVWITDNEGGEIRGTTREWYEWVHSVIRDEEVKSGGETRMIGTNNTDFCDGPFDYCATHDKAPLAAPLAGKHTENNERNPDLGSPEAEYAAFCQAQGQGLHWWFWRAEMNAADMERTLDLFGQGCGGPVGCFPPDSEDPLWVEPPVVGGGMSPAIRQAVADAKVVVGERCGTDHAGSLATIELVAAELRRKGHCAGRGSDALSIADGTVWKEIHVVTFASGCWSQDPANYPKATWTYGGTNPTPPGSCGAPTPPPLSRFNAKEHTKGPAWTTLDSTPSVGPNAPYCAEIGFTDGRSMCPVRQEGAPDREACEAVIVGTPQWTGPGEVHPENPYLYLVSRGVTGTATVCASAAPSICGSVAVTP